MALTEDASSQAVVTTRNREIEAEIEPLCQCCIVNPITCQECPACIEAGKNEEAQKDEALKQARQSNLKRRLRGVTGVVKLGIGMRAGSKPPTNDEHSVENGE